MVTTLSVEVDAELRAAPFTYPDVGATAQNPFPAGYGYLHHSRDLPASRFEEAADRLMSWQVHESAGLRVAASSRRVEPDAAVEMFLGPRWLGVRAVCRVVYVIEDDDRVGFAYGTLPGHQEAGEESFVLERSDDRVTFTVRAFSRPASRLSRMGGPAGRVVQRLVTERYLRSVIEPR